jgi:hypothetical protein
MNHDQECTIHFQLGIKLEWWLCYRIHFWMINLLGQMVTPCHRLYYYYLRTRQLHCHAKGQGSSIISFLHKPRIGSVVSILLLRLVRIPSP